MDGVWLPLAGVVFTALVTFFGVKLTATKSHKASSESTAVTALTEAMNGWIARAKATETDLKEVKQDLSDTKVRMEDDKRKAQRALVATRRYVNTLLQWIEEHAPGHRPPSPPPEYYEDL